MPDIHVIKEVFWAILKSEVFWTALGAIATWLGVLIIFLTARALRFQAWLKAQEIWNDPPFREARGHIFARLDTPNDKWSPAEEKEALQVCRQMDEFAGLIPYLRKRTAIQHWGVPYAKAWLVLSPIVERERIKSGWLKKWDLFTKLGESALRHHPEVRKKLS